MYRNAKVKPTPAVMVFAMLLAGLMLAVIGPHLKELMSLRKGCTVAATATVVDWALSENQRRLQAVVTFELEGQQHRQTLPDLEKEKNSEPSTGEVLKVLVNPATLQAVVANPVRALWVWFGLIGMAVLMFFGALYGLIFPPPKV